jgi:outer membrane protein
LPRALSGYRPSVNENAAAGRQITSQETLVGLAQTQTDLWPTAPRSIGITAQQTLFNGFQTANRTRAAESNVFAARETLRVIEQTVLLDAATVYMDVLRDAAILNVQRSNVRMLAEILRQTRARFKLAEVTRTDVAQAEAQLAAGQSQMLGADSNLTTSKAAYRRVIGSKTSAAATGLRWTSSPRTLAAAIGAGRSPIRRWRRPHGVDVARLQVNRRGRALSDCDREGVERAQDIDVIGLYLINPPSRARRSDVPIYQGGAEHSTIRQSKRRHSAGSTSPPLRSARATVVQCARVSSGLLGADPSRAEQVRAAWPSMGCAWRRGSHCEPPLTCSSPSRLWSTPR